MDPQRSCRGTQSGEPLSSPLHHGFNAPLGVTDKGLQQIPRCQASLLHKQQQESWVLPLTLLLGRRKSQHLLGSSGLWRETEKWGRDCRKVADACARSFTAAPSLVILIIPLKVLPFVRPWVRTCPYACMSDAFFCQDTIPFTLSMFRHQ